MKQALPFFASALAFVLVFIAFPARSNAVLRNHLTELSQASATEIYGRRCASCHGKDGRAKTFKAKFNSARDLTNSQWQADVSDERLFNSIMNGRGRMPAFGRKISEEQVNALVAYVRGLKK
ncbi:MAG: c-type cytochrome [Pyrinomonadaceae bacterium]